MLRKHIIILPLLLAGMLGCCEAVAAPFFDDLEPRTQPAQPRKYPVRWGYGTLNLLSDAVILNELKTNRSQNAKIFQAANAYLRSARLLHDKLNQPALESPQQRAQAAAKVTSEMRALKEQAGRNAEKLLTPQQMVRLDQIAFQIRGVDAFYHAGVQGTLKLRQPQRDAIREIRRSIIRSGQSLGAKFLNKKDSDSRLFKIHTEKLLADGKRRVIEVLDDDQLAVLNRLQGAPIGFLRQTLTLEVRRRDDAGRPIRPQK